MDYAEDVILLGVVHTLVIHNRSSIAHIKQGGRKLLYTSPLPINAPRYPNILYYLCDSM